MWIRNWVICFVNESLYCTKCILASLSLGSCDWGVDTSAGKQCLSTIPHPRNLRRVHLLLQLENPIHQRFRRRRTPRNINIYRNNPINAPNNTIAVVVVSPSICATTHTNYPFGVRHLIITLTKSRGHFVRHRAGYDHDIGLAGRGAKDYAETVLVISWHGRMHHLESTAGEAKTQWP